jgi:hypothetical protein
MNFFNCVGCSKIMQFVINVKNPSLFIFAEVQSTFHNTHIPVCSVLGNRTHVFVYMPEHRARRGLFILYGKPLRRRVCRWGTEHSCRVTISERMLEIKILLFLCTAPFRRNFPSDQKAFACCARRVLLLLFRPSCYLFLIIMKIRMC